MIIIYREIDTEDDGIHELEVENLNAFEGANIDHLQVLKSAAGYYIGCLVKAYWTKPGEVFYEPNFRDSELYFSDRITAEDALKKRNYKIKF
jgi:hypothetical protein